MTVIQSNPTVMCSPWVATSVKKDDKKPLRRQLLPSWIKISKFVKLQTQKSQPEHKSDSKPEQYYIALVLTAASKARPQVKLLVSNRNVSNRA